MRLNTTKWQKLLRKRNVDLLRIIAGIHLHNWAFSYSKPYRYFHLIFHFKIFLCCMNMAKFFLLVLFFVFACKINKGVCQSYTAFTGATIIDGSGATPIKDGVLLIQNGRVVAVGKKDDIKISKNTTIINVSGKTIMPGFINTHGHVGDVKGIEGGHYSLENNIENLAIYARYGITTVVSLGGEKKEAEPLRAIHDTATTNRARLFIAGEVITGETPREAIEVVERNHRMGVDFMKIRVDDQLGTVTKMPEEVYRAVIKRSHELGYKIATHMYSLNDAKNCLMQEAICWLTA